MAAAVSVVTLAKCLALAGATPAPVIRPAAWSIQGMDAVGSPPAGSSWAPRPVLKQGLRLAATAANGRFVLHTAGGDRTFLPGVNLGSTTPGHQPGELSISAGQYRSWFAGMGWLGIRVVRIYTIHPPAFYEELARHNTANPDRPLYLMQGVYLPDESYISKQNLYDQTGTIAFQREIRDAAAAVSGHLTRAPHRGRASGAWTADVTPWLAGWILGVEMDPYAGAASDRRNTHRPAIKGRYFRTTPDATPTERWLAARMNEQNFGLVAMDAAGSPDAATQFLVDDEHAWPARRITARVDESYVRLRIALGSPRPGALTLGFDLLPGLTGPPPPGSGDTAADAAFVLDLVAHSVRHTYGISWIRCRWTGACRRPRGDRRRTAGSGSS